MEYRKGVYNSNCSKKGGDLMLNINITDNSQIVLTELQAKIKNILEACGLTAEAYVKRNTPVNTGRL